MRVSWGTGIAITIVVFMAFILALVIYVVGHKITLTSDDYYQKELAFQSTIDARANGKAFESAVGVSTKEDQVILMLPNSIQVADSLTILMTRPDGRVKDLNHRLNENIPTTVVLSHPSLIGGYYRIDLDWWSNGKHHQVQKTATL